MSDVTIVEVFGEPVGVIKNGVYGRRVKKEHYFKKYKGFAIQASIFDDHLFDNIEFLYLVDGKKYCISRQNFLDKSKLVDYGYGIQRVLALTDWNNDKEKVEV